MATFFNSYQLHPGGVFHRYRLESMALSALLIRKWMNEGDRLALVTDAETLKTFEPLGITSLYDKVVNPTEICGVDPRHFFALIKLRGLANLQAPVYSVDWDLFILTQELFDRVKASKACGLHYECTCGGAYKNPERFAPYLLGGNFDKSPINAGIIGFSTESDKRRYCEFAFNFMRKYSASPLPGHHAVFAMMFAEQQTLGYLRTELGVSVLFDQGASGLFQDGTCSHLWGEKFSLDSSKAEGDRHRKWCRDMMSQQGIDVPSFLDSPGAEVLP